LYGRGCDAPFPAGTEPEKKETAEKRKEKKRKEMPVSGYDAELLARSLSVGRAVHADG
jgi:hypothetical protein